MKRRSFLVGLPAALIAAKRLITDYKPLQKLRIFNVTKPDYTYTAGTDLEPGQLVYYKDGKIYPIKAADKTFINSVTFTSS